MARGEDRESGEVVDHKKPATRIRASALRAALKDVAAIVPSKTTVPIVGDVLFEVCDGRITLTGTDLDTWAMRTLASDDRSGAGDSAWVRSIRNFAVAVPAKALSYAKYDLVRALNKLVDALGLQSGRLERLLARTLAVPASRFLRMQRAVDLLYRATLQHSPRAIPSASPQSAAARRLAESGFAVEERWEPAAGSYVHLIVASTD